MKDEVMKGWEAMDDALRVEMVRAGRALHKQILEGLSGESEEVRLACRESIAKCLAPMLSASPKLNIAALLPTLDFRWFQQVAGDAAFNGICEAMCGMVGSLEAITRLAQGMAAIAAQSSATLAAIPAATQMPMIEGPDMVM